MGVLAVMRRRALVTGLVAAPLAWRGGARAAEPKKRIPILVLAGPLVRLDELPLAKLRSLYLGLPIDDAQGTRLVPLNQPPNSPVRVAFDRLVLGMDSDAVGRYWIDRRMRGQGTAPRAVESTLLLQRLVAKLPGAIAYLKAEPLVEHLRALRIDAHIATDPRYALFVEE